MKFCDVECRIDEESFKEVKWVEPVLYPWIGLVSIAYLLSSDALIHERERSGIDLLDFQPWTVGFGSIWYSVSIDAAPTKFSFAGALYPEVESFYNSGWSLEDAEAMIHLVGFREAEKLADEAIERNRVKPNG